MSLGELLVCVALAAWLVLVYGRSGFWRADQWLGPVPAPGPRPGVVAIVPARNEAETIEAVVRALCNQRYGGPLGVVIVDDASTDGTGDKARAALAGSGADVAWRVIEAPPLAPGWSGKVAAQEAGLEAARSLVPEARYVWFSDADIVHGPLTLERLVAKAGEGRSLVSLMVRLHCADAWERLLIPAFVFFFQMLYPFPAVNRRPSETGGAAGGCLLVERTALADIGGLAAIKGALIDDCALAEAVRRQGHYLWLGHADDSRSIRPYGGLEDLWRMVARTAYTQLGYSPWILAGTVVALLVVFLVPPLAVLLSPWHGSLLALLAGAASLALMVQAYRPTLALYGMGIFHALTLPVAGALYTAMTVDSARQHWQGKGGQWKARSYDFS